MSLLLSGAALAARRDVAAGSLASLARVLADELEPLLSGTIHFPNEKALLSREGGRCPRDGSLLAFDPFSPRAHRCDVCGDVYGGDLHDRFWIYWYQLWLAERAVHAAVLHRLGVDPRAGDLAARILDGYAERYASYPNVDNVLGPTRLFFSTYLESIWLLQLCVAADLLRETHATTVGRAIDRVVEPSRRIIAGYDEGGSNRQVWNDAALLASARVVGDARGAERAVVGASGVRWQLEHGLLADGTWYEGENYHLFAHRGLWYGVTMAEQAGIELPAPLVDRFQRGFSTPFESALPDLTLPSRRDSQYRISLRQWRIAEHCELGLARREDASLVGALYRLYERDVPRRDTARRLSSADVERNAPASGLTRADLSWRALLCARPVLPRLEPVAPRSTLFAGQGLAVFRRNEGRTYVALDYGHSGGGHGHPDRLNLLLANDETRWLDDPGTGSYVDPTLHWYRSTLAHNAPLVGGVSQSPVDGELAAYDERGAAGWIEAVAREIQPGVVARRTLVVTSEYAIDELVVTTHGVPPTTIDLPLHADIRFEDPSEALEPAVLDGGSGLEDGFRFLRDAARQRVAALATARGAVARGVEHLRVWARSDGDAEWWRARAPGPPGSGDQYLRMVRAHGTAARSIAVLVWSDAVAGVDIGDAVAVSMADGSRHAHQRSAEGWHIDLEAHGARSSIDLAGRLARPRPAPAVEPHTTEPPAIELRRGLPRVIPLGENNYRRSEQSWLEAGMPAASVELTAEGDRLHLAIVVPRSERTFVPAGAINRYDNEHADINGDGVQLYLRTASGATAFTLIPEKGGDSVRLRAIDGWTAPLGADLSARWAPHGDGYRMEVDLGRIPAGLDAIVNEKPRGRERRRGQLVLSGAAGEFVYLRGDRHDAARLLPLRVADV